MVAGGDALRVTVERDGILRAATRPAVEVRAGTVALRDRSRRADFYLGADLANHFARRRASRPVDLDAEGGHAAVHSELAELPVRRSQARAPRHVCVRRDREILRGVS